MIKFGSLFSGIGGFDLALERTGFTCAWQCEIDKACQSVLRKHFNTRIYDDVRSINRDNAEPVDLICGGFPCQDLSVAGKRAGLAGERSGLWYEFARIIGEFAPQWVLIENVPGLLSNNGGRDFGIILDQLVKFGYGVAWRVLDAQYFGLAQRRKRVFIVGNLGNGRAAEVLFERESGPGDTAPSREKGQRIAGTLSARTKAGGFPGTDEAIDGYLTYAVRQSQTGSNGWGISEEMFGTLEGAQSWVFATYDGNKVLEFPEISGTLTASGGGLDRPAGNANELDFCIPVSSSTGVRRLTPTECERLQGFPDGWTAGQSDSARYRQLGNAVAVPVVEWIARRIYGSG